MRNTSVSKNTIYNQNESYETTSSLFDHFASNSSLQSPNNEIGSVTIMLLRGLCLLPISVKVEPSPNGSELKLASGVNKYYVLDLATL